MMRGLLSHEYSFKKQGFPSSPSYMPHLPPCKSPKRVNNPLLPPSPRRGYLNQSQHQYGVKRQEYRNNPHFNNDLNLFTNHCNHRYNQQREQLLQQRQQQSKLTSSNNSSPIRAQSAYQHHLQQGQSRQAKQEPPLSGRKHGKPQKESQDYSENSNSIGHLISSTSKLNVDCKDIPSYFLDPKADRFSPKADQYRIRKKLDHWGHVQKMHDQLDTNYSEQHRRMDRTKKNTVKQDLLEQMKEDEERKRGQQAQKMRDYEEMQKQIESDRMKDRKEREQKYAAQRQLKQELDQFGSVQHTITQYQRQKEKNQELQWIEEGKVRAQQERDRQYAKVKKERARWSAIYAENEHRQKLKEQEMERERQADIRCMKEYSDKLAKEEMKRKQFLEDMQKSSDQRDAINFQFLEQKQKKLLEEEQRLIRYQELREQALTRQDQRKKEETKKSKVVYKSFLQKQIEEKQRQKEMEIKGMRRERFELEQEIKRQEDNHQRSLQDKRQQMNDYAAALQKQQMGEYERRIKGQFHMNDNELGYHKQYLESQGVSNKEVIGSFPRESPSRRDMQRFKYLS